MTVRDLIKKLVEMPMDAEVEILAKSYQKDSHSGEKWFIHSTPGIVIDDVEQMVKLLYTDPEHCTTEDFVQIFASYDVYEGNAF